MMGKKRVVIENEDFKLSKNDSAIIFKKNGAIELVLRKQNPDDNVNTETLMITGIAMLLQSGDEEFENLIAKQLIKMNKMIEEMEENEKKVN